VPHLGHEEEDEQRAEAERDGHEPEAELPRQVLHNVAIDERATACQSGESRTHVCHRDEATHSVMPAMIEKLQMTERVPRSWMLRRATRECGEIGREAGKKAHKKTCSIVEATRLWSADMPKPWKTRAPRTDARPGLSAHQMHATNICAARVIFCVGRSTAAWWDARATRSKDTRSGVRT
jgi:hypothetical protein